ncbi:hypothetical protein [Paraburkholderia sp. SIMBA_030]|uniref:hypothetical protein n=1 Tax=Paraburkholderia sp. SIMBA_030 TaxID=3085773 RepID=UPI0039797E9D
MGTEVIPNKGSAAADMASRISAIRQLAIRASTRETPSSQLTDPITEVIESKKTLATDRFGHYIDRNGR